jgi:APA family basic amino acid/polyamine antiporter
MREMASGTREEAKLRRELGIPLAVAVTVNAMVGTGIFRLAPNVLSLAGSSSAALCVWAFGGVVSLCGALCMGELAASMPRAGGIYEFLRRAYGRPVAFWYGWTRLTLLGPSAAGSFARLAAESFDAMSGLAPDATRQTAVASAVLIVCTLVNLSGVRTASTGQALLTALKFLGLVLLGLACVTAAPALPEAASSHACGALTLQGVFAGLVSVMWSYDGWADVSSLSAEAREPGRTLPRALFLGTLAVTAAYVLVNVGYVRVLGEAGIAASGSGADMVAMKAAELALGEGGRRILAALVFSSCVGACMVGVLTGSRVFVSMAADGLFVHRLGVVSVRNGAPVPAVLLTSALAVVYLSVRSFEQLTDSFVAGMFPFYILAVLSLFVLRRREPALPRPFRTPFAPGVAAVFLLGAFGLLWGALGDVHGVAYAAFGVMLAGLPLGVWVARMRPSVSPTSADTSAHG